MTFPAVTNYSIVHVRISEYPTEPFKIGDLEYFNLGGAFVTPLDYVKRFVEVS